MMIIVIVKNCITVLDYIRYYLSRRPLAFIMAFLATLIFAFSQTYLLTTQPLQQREIDSIKSSFCVGPEHDVNRRVCQQLLSNILDNSTNKQKQKLRDIVENKK